MFKVINLTQGSIEWLEYRQMKIGASDAPIIMRESPFKTPEKLYDEKISGSSGPVTPAMRRGTELEPFVRQMINDRYCMEFVPTVLESVERPWQIASMDGVDFDRDCFVEIKCPNQDDHLTAIGHEVPTKYVAQLQHAFAVTGFKKGFYASFHDDDLVVFEVKPDPKKIEAIIEAEKKFYDSLINMEPPKPKGHDFSENDEWNLLASRYRIAKEVLAKAKEEEESIKQELFALADGRECFGGGIKLTPSERKGAIQYKNIPALVDVDLEQYRAPSTHSYRITEIK